MNDSRSGNPELRDFARSVGGALDAVWPAATAAPTADLEKLHAVAVQQGWFELGSAGAVDYLAAAEGVLGERGCPLPLADAYVAARLAPGLAVGTGLVRPVVCLGSATDALVPTDATHVIELDVAGPRAWLVPVARSVPAPGLAVPAWHRLTAGLSEELHVDAPLMEECIAVLRLASAARLGGACRRAHRLAVEHATTRRQFGKVIGAFGAVQQRIATGQIDVLAHDALVDEAARTATDGPAPLACALAARHARDHAISVLAGAQHTLGAIGYFDEHEVAWLFRFVHAEVSRLRAMESAVAPSHGLERLLLADDGALPPLDLGEDAELLRAEVRALLDAHRHDDGFDTEGVRAAAAAAGLFALSWPAEHGGRGASLEEQVVLNEEMKYAGGPVDRAMSATMLIGHSLLRHGSADQKQEFLPLLREGRMAFCLGYSEPDAGSDLASLSTRAVRDGDDWVIRGQKLWTTRAHTASHVWLAVRTDPEAQPRHAGITILLVPMDTPGIIVQQHRALSGEISCSVFYDDVRVPDAARVGEVNGGWRVITDALAAERVLMGGIAATLLGHLDALLRDLRARLDIDPVALDRLGSVAARLQAARVLVVEATRAMDGDDARILGPVSAVLSGHLAEEFGRVALDLLGPEAALDGRYEAMLRLAPMYVIGGGTNDIQRGIIARALGLPR
ncbi:acyl-CoA dehydrogenase family protein [Aeromicrobium sp. YIM 150415]|uniref:acyl-CoA dehydrogenase family protein n=1 Tax=Aeromicrobium sp. YIM 150415 TaxID=2803912 RepID=UPI001963519F|nr:acyl-CoA dehydrogenase family protein [Aeromicrobium sp. YIM 150415]MBM9464211.1 acyl-CoA dehydrogenase family protein [Aeromicrobium sp. YIM 150415]